MQTMATTLPVLQPRVIAGLEPGVKGNINFLSDDEVVYPVGAVVTVHHFNVKKQKFIRLSGKGEHLTNLAVSPDK